MTTYLVLLRGVNVGGNGKVPMAALRAELEKLGYADVATYIASGNVILRSNQKPAIIKTQVEKLLQELFSLNAQLNPVLVLTRSQLQAVVDHKPAGFGEQPDKYYSDVIFLIGLDTPQVMPIFDPREGVDTIWPGKGVIYSQRLGSQRTKSRLSKIVSSPFYKSMTIRSWSTTTKLLNMLKSQV